MKEDKCYLRPFRKSMFSFLVGGVLLSCLLALIPNYVSAVDFPEYNTSDYNVRLFTSNSTQLYGCNTVRSASGVLTVGARGSITGMDNNPSGCGYYMNSQSGLTWRSSGVSSTYAYDLNGQLESGSTPSYIQSSLSNQDYTSKNFRTSVYALGSTGFDPAGVNADYSTISAQSGDSQYGKYIFMMAWKVPNDQYKVASHLTPALDTSRSLYGLPNGVSDEQFNKDVYEHTVMRFAESPNNYVPLDLANYFALKMNLAQCGGWDSCNVAWIISYIPQYSSDYWIQKLQFNVINSYSQNSIDICFGGFSQYEVGFGNYCGSDSWPRLSYFYLSKPYTLSNAWSDNLISDVFTARFNCVSGTCLDQTALLIRNVEDLHNEDTSGWDFSENVGSSWFDVFHFNLAFPFAQLFTSFTNDSCVDIPIIAGWLGTNQNRYCTWWPSSIRSTLTPVFSSISLMLLFGFAVSWLKGRSSNSVSNVEIGRLK